MERHVSGRMEDQRASVPGHTVVVVGAGVSGCAAALELAAQGVKVVLVNSALDSVGLPGYGPVVDISGLRQSAAAGGARGHMDVAGALCAVAGPVAGEWLAHAWEMVGDVPLALVDRRMVSLAVKWRVENERLIETRQGIVVGLEERQPAVGSSASSGRGVAALTAFGERIEGDAVVLAVGLALGGRVSVGTHEQAGARPGEVGADGLFESLRSRGGEFEPVRVTVGARISVRGGRDGCRGGVAPEGPAFSAPGDSGLEEIEFVPVNGAGRDEGVRLREEVVGFVAPPSPYDHSHCALPALVVAQASRGAALSEKDVVLAPDGIATGEWYAQASACFDRAIDSLFKAHASVSRPAYTVSGWVARTGEGPLLPGVWVAGQAAGARGYVESLAGGRRIARQVAGYLGVDPS